ncbi:MAG: N-6 DNA methylase [Verrucomicrobia bacterium]|nr:N-6 DNA methylase [Verrucomicrobiota bacterium]
MAKRKQLTDHPELLNLPEVRKLWQTEGLFSDHSLKARLAKNDWWPTDDAARPVWELCRDLYNKRYLALAKSNEAFTRQELLDHVLPMLGFAWTDNLRLPDQDAEPDYILFATAADKEAALEKDAAQRYRAAVGILEAKKHHHPLLQLSRHQQRYPHQQIRDYLQAAQVLAWGVLTNGNEWRLYCRDAKPHEYFALNFEVAIQSLENFKAFLALFSASAFQRDTQGRCRLDQVREQALSAQAKLEEDLRQRVFTILTDLANGFASRPDNQIPDTPEGHRLLYENCLIYLYRLLFILYAEGRILLPVEPRTRRYYKELSLEHLKPDLESFIGYDSRTRTRLGEDLRELFHLVNGTEKAKNDEYTVPRYNGGLFDPAAHPALEMWKIADADLANVLRGLMFDPPPRPNEPALPVHTVDFGDLRVQQLGSIYEGLLEYHFVRNAASQLELRTDKAERKATGTYYTPDYIVKYIVEQTLAPLLAEIEQRPEVKAGQENCFANAILALNVCDPAMGSGHFLVEATIQLAEHIVFHPTTRRLSEKSKDGDEIGYWRRRVVEACIYGVDLNPLAVELAKLSLWLTCIASDQPLNFLDHHLRCGNSLIGARLDQLGSLPQRKERADTKQMRFTFGPDFMRAVAETIREIHAIEGEASRDVDSVKAKERRWQAEILPRLAAYKEVANLWTNTFFDGPLTEAAYLAAARKILLEAQVNAGQLRESGGRYYVKEFDKPYFHWELEFPDVFFDDHGSPKNAPGFDAVIGNPPYVDIKGLEAQIVKYIFDVFQTARQRINVFAAFLDQELGIARKAGGQIGVIVPTAFLTQVSYGTLRKLVLEHEWLKAVVRLPNELFGKAAGDVKVDTCIVIIGKGQGPAGRATECLIYEGFGRIPKVARETAAKAFDVLQEKWLARPSAEITLGEGDEDLLNRVVRVSQPLEQLCEFCLGLTPYDKYTGHTEEQIKGRVFHARSKLDKTCERLLVSGDVKRFEVEWNGEEWIKYGDWLAAPRERRFFTQSRILVQQIIDWSSLRILAGWTDEELYNTQNQFNLLARRGTDLKFVLALLNSRLISFYHRRAFLDVALQRFQKVLIKDAKQFPIRHLEFCTTPAKRTALFAKAQELYRRDLKAESNETVQDFVVEQLAAKPERADVVHDLLAFLADRMMALNRVKRSTARQFLTDLKDFHGIDARVLNPKTRLDEFWTLDTAGFFAHLRRNAKALAAAKVDLNEAAEKKLRSRLGEARSAVLALEPQIAFTDRLIDQIVYRLYGLTEEEIQLVESTTKI